MYTYDATKKILIFNSSKGKIVIAFPSCYTLAVGEAAKHDSICTGRPSNCIRIDLVR